MAKTPPKGRTSIFRGKTRGTGTVGVRVQAVLTQTGGRAFEQRRKELARLYRDAWGTDPKVLSDAEVIEFMARGTAETIAAIAKLGRA